MHTIFNKNGTERSKDFSRMRKNSEERARISTKGVIVPIRKVRTSKGFSCDVVRACRYKGLSDAFGDNSRRAYEHFTSRTKIFQSCVRRAVCVHQQVHHPRRSSEGQKRSRTIKLLTPLRGIFFYLYSHHIPSLNVPRLIKLCNERYDF